MKTILIEVLKSLIQQVMKSTFANNDLSAIEANQHV